jgi:hypothetical protein
MSSKYLLKKRIWAHLSSCSLFAEKSGYVSLAISSLRLFQIALNGNSSIPPLPSLY